MKYGIDIGHNCPPDSGAVGIRREDDLAMEVGTKVIAKLRKIGHEIIECKPSSAKSVSDSLNQRCLIANRAKVDVFVSIHFNAFNGQANGSEIFAISHRGKEIAARVLPKLCKLGYRNRGVKSKRFLILRKTMMPAILVECCFCDSQRDMALFDAEKMACAIVEGLTEK